MTEMETGTMQREQIALLRFHPGLKRRVWGGRRLGGELETAAQQTPFGENWLISDHPEHESIVAEGPLAGKTLRELVRDAPALLLGPRPTLTRGQRFPLLLKLLDAAEPLSVQVHPSDELAATLGEQDPGKTEMWHVLAAATDASLICGLRHGVTRESFEQSLRTGTVMKQLEQFPSPAGTTVFVPAGTVHAINAGLFLVEIQQNSDLTYRLFDYERADASGTPRELHLEKGLAATQFDFPHAGPSVPLEYVVDGATCSVLGACRHFAARKFRFNGPLELPSHETFHLLMALEGTAEVRAAGITVPLEPLWPVLVAGAVEAFELTGCATVIDFFVPDLMRDVLHPLRAAGHSDGEILRLGGGMNRSDLMSVL